MNEIKAIVLDLFVPRTPPRDVANRPPNSIQESISKVVSVALASCWFFGMQLNYSYSATSQVTAGLATATCIGELARRATPSLRKTEIKWFSDVEESHITELPSLQLDMAVPKVLSGVRTGFLEGSSVKGVLLSSLKTPLVAFSEEILFRGFLAERLEEVLFFVSQGKLSPQCIHKIVGILQALVFGGVHINYHPAVRGLLCLCGILLFNLKTQGRSLFLPIVDHSIHNWAILLGEAIGIALLCCTVRLLALFLESPLVSG